MNYLAHTLLGDHSPQGLVGSLMGDFVRGPIRDQWPSLVANGIRVHRAIDSYTDAHPVHRRSRTRFAGPRRRFAGVIVDVCYDHFLSRHWERFAPEPLDAFAPRVYRALQSYPGDFPGRLSKVVPRMIAQDWLRSYHHVESVGHALDGIARRRPRASALDGSIDEVRAHYRGLEDDFLAFFPALARYAERARGGSDAVSAGDPAAADSGDSRRPPPGCA